MTEQEERLAARLARMIRCRTLSNSDIHKVDWQEFEKLHEVLRESYPHVFQSMELDEVGEAGLQFCLKGTGSGKKPLLLMSHQDVVETGDRSQWDFDPFGGDIIDGCVCGRGSTDCKHLLLAELEAVDGLLAQGWRPDYDLYISLGFSEEVYLENDVDGGEQLTRNLEKKGVHLGAVIDEGSEICLEQNGILSARIGLAEKSPVNYEIFKNSPGGHSSKPGQGTALGAVARAIVAIESHPFPYRLTPLAKAQLQATAPLTTPDRKPLYEDPEGHWEELCRMALEDPSLDALLHTTIAFTMSSASNQPNVLPSHATAQMSVRIMQGDTVDSCMEYFKQFLPEGVQIRHVSGKDPLPASDPDSYICQKAGKVLKDMYGDKLHICPFLFLGGTDSHYYKRIADSVMLFSGYRRDDRWGGMHQVNEKIPVDALPASVEFFTRLLKEY